LNCGLPTRFAFVLALRDRFKRRQWNGSASVNRRTGKARAEKTSVTARLVPGRVRGGCVRTVRGRKCRVRRVEASSGRRAADGQESLRRGCRWRLRATDLNDDGRAKARRISPRCLHADMPRARSKSTDGGRHGCQPKTTFPKIAGSYKLPPSSLLHRPTNSNRVNEDEAEVVAQVLTAKYANSRSTGSHADQPPRAGCHHVRVQTGKPASNDSASLDSRTIFA